jgi:hypothetical protein
MIQRKIRLLIMVCITLFSIQISGSCQSKQDIEITMDEHATSILEHYDSIIPVMMTEQDIPALSIALIDHDGCG